MRFFKAFLLDLPTSQSLNSFWFRQTANSIAQLLRLQLYLAFISKSNTQTACSEIKSGLHDWLKIIVCFILQPAIKETIIFQEPNGILICVWGETTSRRNEGDTRRKCKNGTFDHNIWNRFEGINHQSKCHSRIQQPGGMETRQPRYTVPYTLPWLGTEWRRDNLVKQIEK